MKEMIVAYIRDNMGLDEEFAGELIDDYRSTITEYIGKAHAAIEASDAAGMRRIGHTIKGFSANIGARAGACARLEAPGGRRGRRCRRRFRIG